MFSPSLSSGPLVARCALLGLPAVQSHLAPVSTPVCTSTVETLAGYRPRLDESTALCHLSEHAGCCAGFRRCLAGWLAASMHASGERARRASAGRNCQLPSHHPFCFMSLVKDGDLSRPVSIGRGGVLA